MILSNGKLYSEGKLLEVMPVILTNIGEPYMLPPIVYRVPNWLLGYENSHPINTPVSYHFNQRVTIAGTRSSANHSLEMWTRVMEDSEMGMHAATVSGEAVAELVELFKAENQKR